MQVTFIDCFEENKGYIAKDLLYGCCCGGKRIANAEYPPLDLISIATLLEKKGHCTQIGFVARSDALIVSSNASTLQEDLGYLKAIKEKNLGGTTIVFGSAATFQTKEMLETGAVDFAIIGEPEYTIKNLIEGIQERKFKKIRGVAYIKKGRVYTNPPAPPKNLDSLPIPNRKMLRSKEYFNPLVTKKPWTTMLTTRGCNGRCTFCLSPKFYGGRVIAKNIEGVIEELKLLQKEGYKEVFFRDETFTWNRKRTCEICKRIVEEKIELSWIANAKIGTVDKKTLEVMKKAGCEVLKIGVESGNQQILDNIRKDTTLKQTEKTFEWTKEIGIKTHAHFMLGCPGETNETIIETIEFAKKIEPDTATFGILTPYPGTDIFEHIKDKIKKLDYSGEHTKAKYNELFTDLKKEELEKALKSAYKQFYFRPTYFLGRVKKLKSIRDVYATIKSARAITEFLGS